MKDEFNTYNTLPTFLRIKRGKKESIINKSGQQEQSQTGVHPAQAGIERLMLVLTTGYRQQQATRVTEVHEEWQLRAKAGPEGAAVANKNRVLFRCFYRWAHPSGG